MAEGGAGAGGGGGLGDLVRRAASTAAVLVMACKHLRRSRQLRMPAGMCTVPLYRPSQYNNTPTKKALLLHPTRPPTNQPYAHPPAHPPTIGRNTTHVPTNPPAHLRSTMVVMGRMGSLQKTLSWKSCSRRWRNTDTGAEGTECTSWPHPHWCSTGGRIYRGGKQRV